MNVLLIFDNGKNASKVETALKNGHKTTIVPFNKALKTVEERFVEAIIIDSLEEDFSSLARKL